MNSRTADDVVQKTHNWSDRKRLFTDARSGSLYWLLRRRGGSSHSRAIEGYGVWLLAHPLAPPGRRALVVDHVSPGREVPVLRALGLRIHVLRAARSCRSADRAAKRLASGSCLLISSSIQSRALAQTSGSSNHSIATFGLPIAPAKSCRCWLVMSETASLRFRSNSSKIIPKISTPLCTSARAPTFARRVL